MVCLSAQKPWYIWYIAKKIVSISFQQQKSKTYNCFSGKKSLGIFGILFKLSYFHLNCNEIRHIIFFSGKQIGFHAEITKGIRYSAKEKIVFPVVRTNEGGGYDGKTGKFKAPEAGLYFFSVMVTSDHEKYVSWYLKSDKQSEPLSKPLAYIGGKGSGSATGTAVVKLAQDEEVYVTLNGDNGNENGKNEIAVRVGGYTYPTFSGFLISNSI